MPAVKAKRARRTESDWSSGPMRCLPLLNSRLFALERFLRVYFPKKAKHVSTLRTDRQAN